MTRGRRPGGGRPTVTPPAGGQGGARLGRGWARQDRQLALVRVVPVSPVLYSPVPFHSVPSGMRLRWLSPRDNSRFVPVPPLLSPSALCSPIPSGRPTASAPRGNSRFVAVRPQPTGVPPRPRAPPPPDATPCRPISTPCPPLSAPAPLSPPVHPLSPPLRPRKLIGFSPCTSLRTPPRLVLLPAHPPIPAKPPAPLSRPADPRARLPPAPVP